MLLYNITISEDPRTKKNHAMIAGVGDRCPVCHKPARQFIRQAKSLDDYEKKAVRYIRIPKEPISTLIHVKYHFYMKTRRVVDDLNLCAEMDDLLHKCGVIADDNSRIIRSHDGTRVFYDKANPRTEVFIYDYKEEEDAEVNLQN